MWGGGGCLSAFFLLVQEKAEWAHWSSMMRMRGGGDEQQQGGDEQHEQHEQQQDELAIVLEDLCMTPRHDKAEDESMSPPTERVRRQLSFGSASSASSTKQMRLHNFFHSPSASAFSDETVHETPSPPAKKPRHRMNRMEDTLRQMVRTGQLSLDGKKLSLTSDEVPRLQHEVAKEEGRSAPEADERGARDHGWPQVQRPMRKFEMTVPMKHRVCQEVNANHEQHPAEVDMLKAFARKNKMRFDKLQDIWGRQGHMGEHGR